MHPIFFFFFKVDQMSKYTVIMTYFWHATHCFSWRIPTVLYAKNRKKTFFIPTLKSKLKYLTLKLLIATIVVLEGYANSKTCPTYDTPDATIQTKCSYTGRIQTHCSSLESKVLDFTHTNKDREYWISSFQQLRHSLCQFYLDFLEKKPMSPKSFPVRKR